MWTRRGATSSSEVSSWGFQWRTKVRCIVASTICIPIWELTCPWNLGGALAVRNVGKELLFDWSTSSENGDGSAERPVIQWAAFYSDCEHEVREVVSGHRLTLTYNLFLTRGHGHLAGSAPMLDPTQLPLYNTLYQALETPGFLRRGQSLLDKHSIPTTNDFPRSRSCHMADTQLCTY